MSSMQNMYSMRHSMNHYLGVIWTVQESLDSSCTLEPNNSAEDLNSAGRMQHVNLETDMPKIAIILLSQKNIICFIPGKEGQHWSLSQDLLGPLSECTDSI